jgi:hypothetical protein
MSYDSWLEAPFQRRYAGRETPDEVAELIDAKVWSPTEGEVGVITEYEAWEDADEDGRYGGYTVSIRFGHHTVSVEATNLINGDEPLWIINELPFDVHDKYEVFRCL